MPSGVTSEQPGERPTALGYLCVSLSHSSTDEESRRRLTVVESWYATATDAPCVAIVRGMGEPHVVAVVLR